MRRRPKTSLHGAQIKGPTTKPSTKIDVTDGSDHASIYPFYQTVLTHDIHLIRVSRKVFPDIKDGRTHHGARHGHAQHAQRANSDDAPLCTCRPVLWVLWIPDAHFIPVTRSVGYSDRRDPVESVRGFSGAFPGIVVVEDIGRGSVGWVPWSTCWSRGRCLSVHCC